MRAARLVGLSPDGRSLIVATDAGEELALAADDRLRAALRGDRPRLGQLEIEMQSALSPREIQMRIRSGDSLEDVARQSGMPIDRVERFAAPVLAEREHVASLAMASSVRRRGETSGHRALRTVLQERLHGRGVDLDTLRLDSFRLADGRWGVTAGYQSGEAQRQAEFLFDPQARYSVAGNDDARWILGESSSSRGPQPGRRRTASGEASAEDTEPTLDLSDELALVRAIQEPAETLGPDKPAVPDEPAETEETSGGLAVVHTLHPLPDGAEGADPIMIGSAEQDIPANGSTLDDSSLDEQEDPEEPDDEPGGLEVLDAIFDGPEPPVSAPEDGPAVPLSVVHFVDDGWEPAIVVDYPVEPGQDELDEDEPVPDRPPALADRFDERAETSEDLAEVERESDAPADQAPGPDPVTEEDPAPEPVAPKPNRRKRAAVPSWDEIMFGGPKKS